MTLYVCATPIGNLKDITLRALDILSSADIVLCEDTRTSKHLFSTHGIRYKRLVALHEHNENEISAKVIEWLEDGLTIVQISDAGTPGISDPGARLCNNIRRAEFNVSPLPGACAYISLLSVSGLSDNSLFHGFLPNTKTARSKILSQWADVSYAVCIYEAPHRIVACMTDIVECLGETREIIMGRELTKQFETIKKLPAGELLNFITSDSNQQRGEFVLIIAPQPKNIADELTTQQLNVLNLLAKELPPKKAIQLTHQIIGGNKDLMYTYLIQQK